MTDYTEADLRKARKRGEQYMMKLHGTFLAFISALMLLMLIIEGYVPAIIPIILLIWGVCFFFMGVVWMKQDTLSWSGDPME